MGSAHGTPVASVPHRDKLTQLPANSSDIKQRQPPSTDNLT